MPAIIEITEKLKKAGLSELEIDYLLARFLEEEAENYLIYTDEMTDLLKQKENITIH